MDSKSRFKNLFSKRPVQIGAAVMAVAALGFGGYKFSHKPPTGVESVADADDRDEDEEADSEDVADDANHAVEPADAGENHSEEPKSEAHAEGHAGESHGESHAAHHAAHDAVAPDESAPLTFESFVALSTYRDAWHRVHARVEEIERLDDENERLRMENAHLRVSLESAKFDSRAKDFLSRTQTLGDKVSHDAGIATGRVLASIEYRPPTQLLPEQLYTLAVSYLKAREDEKAAVILTLLTELEDNEDFKNAKNFVLTGLAWYRVDNLDMANHYFDRALGLPAQASVLKYQAQARLWKGLVAYRQNDRPKSQQWLRGLIEHFPHSSEANWVNSKEGIREPASGE